VIQVIVWDHRELTIPAGSFRDSASSGQQIGEDADKPEIFRLDGRYATGMLLAERFDLQAQDVVFVDAASISQWNRVLSQLLPSINVIGIADGFGSKWRPKASMFGPLRYVGVALGKWMVAGAPVVLGRVDSLILSTNTGPSQGIVLQRINSKPFETKWLGWIGPCTFTTFLKGPSLATATRYPIHLAQRWYNPLAIPGRSQFATWKCIESVSRMVDTL
jgi:hypothetical protein